MALGSDSMKASTSNIVGCGDVYWLEPGSAWLRSKLCDRFNLGMLLLLANILTSPVHMRVVPLTFCAVRRCCYQSGRQPGMPRTTELKEACSEAIRRALRW